MTPTTPANSQNGPTATDVDFSVTKIECQFKDVPARTKFYIALHYGRCPASSIPYWKEAADDQTAYSPEWGTETFVPNYPCRYYI